MQAVGGGANAVTREIGMSAGYATTRAFVGTFHLNDVKLVPNYTLRRSSLDPTV
jgi:hypothetical protein